MDATPKHPDYDRHYAEWQRTLPNASHEALHDKVLKHLAFKEQSQAVATKPQSLIPCQFFPVKCEFQEPRVTKIPWELRAIVILLGLIFLSMVAKIAHGDPAPPLPIPFSRVMMLPQAGNVPIPLPIQGSGSSSPVYVICSSGCSAAGAFADNSAFTVGTTPGSILFGYYTSGSAPTLSTGNAARARIDSNSYLIVDCATGCSAGSLTNNNAAPTNNLSGVMPAVANAAAQSWSEGNQVLLSVDLAGRQRVTGAGGTFPVTGTFWQATQPVSGTFWQTTQPVSGTFWQATQPVSGTFWQATQPVSGTFWQTTQPISAASLPLPSGASTAAKQPALGTAGSASADVITIQGIASMTKLLVTPDSVALPANQSVNENQIGGTGVVANPCQEAVPTTVAISQTANTKIISNSTGKKNYICSILIIAGAAEIPSLVEGTGSTCGTNTTAVVGSTTTANGMSLAANGGFTMGSGAAAVIPGINASYDTCLFQNGSNRLAGMISYVQE